MVLFCTVMFALPLDACVASGRLVVQAPRGRQASLLLLLRACVRGRCAKVASRPVRTREKSRCADHSWSAHTHITPHNYGVLRTVLALHTGSINVLYSVVHVYEPTLLIAKSEITESIVFFIKNQEEKRITGKRLEQSDHTLIFGFFYWTIIILLRLKSCHLLR